MNNMDITKYSFNVSEEEYRNDPALSYSMIARYAREGFSCIPYLRERQESQSLTLGSMLDCLVTEGFEAYCNRYVATKFNQDNKSYIVLKNLFQFCNPCHTRQESLKETFSRIDQNTLKNFLDNQEYYCNRKFETRIKELLEYQKLWEDIFYADKHNKILVPEQLGYDTKRMYNSLVQNNLTNDILFIKKGYNQIKFKTIIDGVPLRCMFDKLIVDDERKTFIPVDLKTTSTPLYNFEESFIHWRYDIQVRLYSLILQNVIKDTEYKDYTISPYIYIVVNKNFNEPLCFKFGFNLDNGIVQIKDRMGNEVKFENPIILAKELQKEIDNYNQNHSEFPTYLNPYIINELFK